jgi:hypothetical protein
MANHRSLKHTLFQAEIQKNSQKQAFTHSDSKQNGKETFDLLPSANMRKRISNIHESTRRFNTHTQKNLKEQLTVHSKRQNTDANRKKQPNSTISTHREAHALDTQGRNKLCRQHMPGKTCVTPKPIPSGTAETIERQSRD